MFGTLMMMMMMIIVSSLETFNVVSRVLILNLIYLDGFRNKFSFDPVSCFPEFLG